jgi:hypothetical protein
MLKLCSLFHCRTASGYRGNNLPIAVVTHICSLSTCLAGLRFLPCIWTVDNHDLLQLPLEWPTFAVWDKIIDTFSICDKKPGSKNTMFERAMIPSRAKRRPLSLRARISKISEVLAQQLELCSKLRWSFLMHLGEQHFLPTCSHPRLP